MTAAVETARPANPSTKKSRTLRYRGLREGLGSLDLTVRKGKKVEEFSYYVESLGTVEDEGTGRLLRCFRLTKDRYTGGDPEASSYAVQVDADADGEGKPARHSCECKGFLRWGGLPCKRLCKHLSALLTLIRTGKI